MKFFVGMHQPCDAWRVPAAFISVHRLRGRIRGFPVNDWILDSGAFTTLDTHGRYIDTPAQYAGFIRGVAGIGNLLAAVSQDYMCEPFMLVKTELTIADHQRLTIDRYDALTACDTAAIYIMPVLQGYAPADYVDHIRQYGARLKAGMWVGVGSICKRNGRPEKVLAVLEAIYKTRRDLRLHAFGLKITALADPRIVALLHSADSLAWSLAARWAGRSPNDWREADRFRLRIEGTIAA